MENDTKKTEINPAMKNMLFMMLEEQTGELMKKEKLKNTFGRLKELFYIISPDKKVQQIRWTKKVYNPKTDEIVIDEEQLKGFCQLVSVDTENLFEDAKYYFIKMDFQKQVIFFEKHKKDGTTFSDIL